MKNIPPKSTSNRTGNLRENLSSTVLSDRVESIPFTKDPWQEFHVDIKIAIINVDNSPRGDGSICATVLKALMNLPGLPPYTDIIDCSRGGLLKTILSQGYQYAWILDAVDMGLSPGKWLCFKPTNGIHHTVGRQSYMTMHYADVVETLTLGDAMDVELPYLEIYYIQPVPIEESDRISAPIERGILEICGSILYSLKRRVSENGEDINR